MKKTIYLLLATTISLELSACGVSKEDYKDAVEEAVEYSLALDDATAENERLTKELQDADEKYSKLSKEYEDYKESIKTTEAVTEPVQPKMVKTTDRARLRATPSTDDANNVLSTVDAGTLMEYVRDEDEEWAVVTVNGAECYISKQFITPAD